MTTRIRLLAPLVALGLSACVDRGAWQPATQLAPQALGASQALATAQVDVAAWPADAWWHGYGDPQLDALVEEALAGSPTLQTAEARLRAAQGAGIAARAALLPQTALDASVTRQRFPVNGLYPPPYAGNYWNQGEVTARLQL